MKTGGAPTSRWQQAFDAELTDVFQVQSEIATKVAQVAGRRPGGQGARRLAASPRRTSRPTTPT